MSAKQPGRLISQRMWRWLMLISALLIAGVTLPAMAQAAPSRFTVEYCDSSLPAGNPPAWEFHTSPGAGFFPFQTCAAPGGALEVKEQGLVETVPGWIEVFVPETPGGFAESETISGFASNLQPGNQQSHIKADGWPLNNGGDTPRFFHISSGLNSLSNGGSFNIVMGCSNAPCNPGGTIAAHYIAVTEVDLVPPSIIGVGGSLLAGGVLRGHQSVSAEAVDVGGGVTRVDVLVNGIPAAAPTPGVCGVAPVANQSYTGLAAISPTPCLGRVPAGWVLDTAGYPFNDGANTVQICASDLATVGNPSTTCSAAQTVEVDNSCADSPVSGGQVLSTTFAKSDADSVTVPFGHPAEVQGELANSAGNPISGATICVQAQTEGTPGGPTPVATATTDANGQFSYELPGGPNRQVLVGYRHDDFQVGRTISYAAHSRPTLRLRPGRIGQGGHVRLTGKLPGPRAARRVVVLQASALHGRRWLTFRRATTGRRGYFSATYRFGATTQTITYRIRAVVPLQNGYPYAAGHSKPARVKVRAGGKR